VVIGLLARSVAGLPPEIPVTVLISFAILGVPFGYWLPIARAKFVGGNMWALPSQTLLMPRFLVCLIATMTIGAAIGGGVLGIVLDYRYLILGLGYMLFSAAFTYSALRRFLHHPLTEFVMPLPFPFPSRGRM
jgi:hypothetical protein